MATEKCDVNGLIDCKKSIIVYIKHRELCMKWVGSHVYCVLKVVTRFTADKITGNKKIVWLHYAMYLQGIGDFKESI
jgi:hypothetical protein